MLVPMVIEKTSMGERAMDIKSRLLQDRIIMVDDVINPVSASLIVSQLIYLESVSREQDIVMYVSSPGGSVSSGLAILDTMNYIMCDVQTVVMGQAASFGSLIASSGTKGKRFILPSATHLIHQPLIMGDGISGQATDIMIHANEMQRLKEQLTNIYVKNTGQTLERLMQDLERDYIMTAPECVTYGLADEVITRRL